MNSLALSSLSLIPAYATPLLLGEISIHPERKAVSFEVDIKHRDRAIEYILVGEQGKLHETLFSSDVDIIQLNAALQLLDLTPGTPVIVKASWNLFGEDHEEAINHWFEYDDQEIPSPVIRWVYTGSQFSNEGEFLAAKEENLISIQEDANALISFSGTGNENANYWIALTKQIPLVDSLTLIIEKPL